MNIIILHNRENNRACDVAAPFNILCVMSCVHYMEAVCFEQYLINHLQFKSTSTFAQTFSIIDLCTNYIQTDYRIFLVVILHSGRHVKLSHIDLRFLNNKVFTLFKLKKPPLLSSKYDGQYGDNLFVQPVLCFCTCLICY